MRKIVYNPPKVISEIGVNHNGDSAIAKELIKLSKDSGAHAVQFRKANPKEHKLYSTPFPIPLHAYGRTYGEHFQALEFTIDKHAEFKNHCENLKILYSVAVYDVTSALQVLELNPAFINIPAEANTNFQLLEILRDKYKGPVHVSLGMTTTQEREDIVSFFEKTNQAKDRLVICASTSGYPVSFEDVCLLEISKLKEEYESRVREITFFGHHLGIAIDVAAYTLGATWVERHFTKDRSWKGTEHAASLETAGLQKLCRDLQGTYKALTYKTADILPVEQSPREKLKYREI